MVKQVWRYEVKKVFTLRANVAQRVKARASLRAVRHGVRQTLASLRGQWFATRGAKVAVTFHPAFLLRDPRQKAEAWKDLQRVMAELGLKAAARQG